MIFPLTLVDGKIEEGRTRRKHNIIGMTSYYGEDHNTLIATFVFELSCPVANEFLLPFFTLLIFPRRTKRN